MFQSKTFRSEGLTALLLTITLLTSVGCATTKAVREIVAQSNAAMIDVPSLTVAPDPNAPDWKDAVARIDRLIEQNPDQQTLIATLRLRQAVLLTSRQQVTEANEAWKKVDGSQLTTQRDKALYSLHKDLVWWYDLASKRAFGNDDIAQARRVKNRFSKVCDGLTRQSDIRFYLETMRAQIGLKAANSTDVFEKPALQQQVSNEMVADLKRLVDQYSAEDYQWVRDPSTASQTESDAWLARLRARVWLRDTIRKYREAATDLDLTPEWDPAWLGHL